MELEKIKQRAVNEFYPEKEELDSSNRIFEKIQAFIQEEYSLESHFAGSASRGTCMTGDKDIDTFVLFPEDTTRQELENKGLKIGKQVFEQLGEEYHVEYAEHPYTKGFVEGHEVEIVPCYDLEKGELESAVDRTPHHTEWVKNNLDEQQRKDVVVLKAFLQAQGLYGSSLEIQGFSGYLCEILIAYFGSFEELIREASEWRREKRIDYGESEKEFESNFVVVDPVDPDRNVAAVMTEENYAKFIFKAYRLKENPSYSMFSKKEDFSEFELKKEIDRRADLLVLDFDRPDQVNDILYPQMRKLKRLLLKKLEKNDFRIYSSGEFVGNQCRIFFEVDRHLPDTRIVKGPQVFHNSKHIDQFTEKYSNIFVEEERVCAKIDREFTDAQALLKHVLRGDVSELKERGVPNQLSSYVEESKFVDPMEGEDKWLKYLFTEFNCESK
ncbi:MAG: CCA tRNA nucleotidyltransferase [Candidatus Nanohaloarchaea archaeon]